MRTADEIVNAMRGCKNELLHIKAEREHVEWLLAQLSAREWENRERSKDLDEELAALVNGTEALHA